MFENSITKLSKDSLSAIYNDIVNKFDVPCLQEHGGAFIFESDKKDILNINNIIEIDVKIRGSHENGSIYISELDVKGGIEGEEVKLEISGSIWAAFEIKIRMFLEDYFKDESLDQNWND